MRKIRTTQRSIFDSDYVDHAIGEELSAMSVWLDEHPELLELVSHDIDPKGRARIGRDGLTVEVLLRCALLKQYRQVGYRELVFLLKDSRSFQHFTRIDSLKVPAKSALQSGIGRIRADTWEAFNHALLQSAQTERIELGQQVRFDATVTETHIISPSDSRLLLDGVRVSVRLLVDARDHLGADAIVFHNHLRVAKRRHRAIRSARGQDRRAALYRDLLEALGATLNYLEQARQAVADSADPIWSCAWQASREHYLRLIRQVVDQTERRVFAGETVPAQDKIVSLFEPHTDIIRKGGRDTQYGHKITLGTGKSGLVMDVVIEAGNPADTECLLPMLQRHVEHYGAAPRNLATDGGYTSKANLAAAKNLGVENVAFHKKKGLSIEAMTGKRWLYYKLKRFRAGIEAGISYLKRCFGMSRCNWKGLDHFKAYVWSSIVAHNLVIFGRLRAAPT